MMCSASNAAPAEAGAVQRHLHHGLAPLMVEKIFSTIAEVTADGVAVLLVEQNARAALKLAQRAYVMESGCITLEGPAAELAADERVRAAYLGE